MKPLPAATRPTPASEASPEATGSSAPSLPAAAGSALAAHPRSRLGHAPQGLQPAARRPGAAAPPAKKRKLQPAASASGSSQPAQAGPFLANYDSKNWKTQSLANKAAASAQTLPYRAALHHKIAKAVQANFVERLDPAQQSTFVASLGYSSTKQFVSEPANITQGPVPELRSDDNRLRTVTNRSGVTITVPEFDGNEQGHALTQRSAALHPAYFTMVEAMDGQPGISPARLHTVINAFTQARAAHAQEPLAHGIDQGRWVQEADGRFHKDTTAPEDPADPNAAGGRRPTHR